MIKYKFKKISSNNLKDTVLGFIGLALLWAIGIFVSKYITPPTNIDNIIISLSNLYII